MPDSPITVRQRIGEAPLLGGSVALIAACSVAALVYAEVCNGEACLMVLAPLYSGLALLAVHVLVLVPVRAVRRRRVGEPAAGEAAAWVATAVAAYVMPYGLGWLAH